MCVCDLGFKCVCAIWEGYILNPPARGWSPPSRRPSPLSSVVVQRPAVPSSSCRLLCCRRVVSSAVVSCAVVSCAVVSCRPVVQSPGRVVCLLSSLRPSFALSRSPYSLAPNSFPTVHLCLFSFSSQSLLFLPDFTRSKLFLARLFFFFLFTATRRALT